MASNVNYRGPADLPDTIPVFPLTGALLLPRGNLPLNIFEPRYLAMIDDALRGARLIGMIQPDETAPGAAPNPPLYDVGCVGRITQFQETGDGRYLIALSGVARFRVREELTVITPYRQCRVAYSDFEVDFTPNAGTDVDRDALLKTLAEYLEANSIEADWAGIREAPIEALVNGLSMMSPYGPKEKQALLEAADLKSRAELLIAVTEFALAEQGEGGEKPLQ
ncbi:MAG: LON peptidase substrate-binding domain-containing protein [Bradyrhizobiaceae bacterium]|nr:LON peptidase substrate-binding domain-containing protein [Bradyrhizobiaceae bacterium]